MRVVCRDMPRLQGLGVAVGEWVRKRGVRRTWRIKKEKDDYGGGCGGGVGGGGDQKRTKI